MGWSCTKAAMDTLQKIERALCIGRIQNVYRVRNTDYMIETSRVEHVDGAITGSIFNLTDYTGKACNSFRIEEDGTVSRGPSEFQKAAKGQKIKTLEAPKYGQD